MTGDHNNKIAIRKEIASLIDALKSESDRIGNDNLFPKLSMEQLISTIEELHRKTIVYSFLDSLPEEKKPEEKPSVEIREAVSIPTPEPVAPQPEVVRPIVFENPVVQIPVVPVEQKPKQEIPNVAPAKKYPDIKTLIGFNERLMFLKYLFNSDGSSYEAAISQINNCSSLEEANAFLTVVGTEYKWNSESEPVFIFNSIVKRRFA